MTSPFACCPNISNKDMPQQASTDSNCTDSPGCTIVKTSLAALQLLSLGALSGLILADGALTIMSIGVITGASICSLAFGTVLGILFIGLTIFFGYELYKSYF